MEASQEVKTVQDDPVRQKEIIVSYLEYERDKWLGARAVRRETPCGETYAVAKEHSDKLDNLLEAMKDLGLASGTA